MASGKTIDSSTLTTTYTPTSASSPLSIASTDAIVASADAGGVCGGLDDPRLGEGFSRLEAGWRWTDGRARLPADLWAECAGPALLRLDLAGPALPHWVAPDKKMIEAESGPRRVDRKGA